MTALQQHQCRHDGQHGERNEHGQAIHGLRIWLHPADAHPEQVEAKACIEHDEHLCQRRRKPDMPVRPAQREEQIERLAYPCPGGKQHQCQRGNATCTRQRRLCAQKRHAHERRHQQATVQRQVGMARIAPDHLEIFLDRDAAAVVHEVRERNIRAVHVMARKHHKFAYEPAHIAPCKHQQAAHQRRCDAMPQCQASAERQNCPCGRPPGTCSNARGEHHEGECKQRGRIEDAQRHHGHGKNASAHPVAERAVPECAVATVDHQRHEIDEPEIEMQLHGGNRGERDACGHEHHCRGRFIPAAGKEEAAQQEHIFIEQHRAMAERKSAEDAENRRTQRRNRPRHVEAAKHGSVVRHAMGKERIPLRYGMVERRLVPQAHILHAELVERVMDGHEAFPDQHDPHRKQEQREADKD